MVISWGGLGRDHLFNLLQLDDTNLKSHRVLLFNCYDRPRYAGVFLHAGEPLSQENYCVLILVNSSTEIGPGITNTILNFRFSRVESSTGPRNAKTLAEWPSIELFHISPDHVHHDKQTRTGIFIPAASCSAASSIAVTGSTKMSCPLDAIGVDASELTGNQPFRSGV